MAESPRRTSGGDRPALSAFSAASEDVVLAVLSLAIVPIPLGAVVLICPVGPLMARWCWWATDEALDAHRKAHSPAVAEILVARGVASVFAVVSLTTFVVVLITTSS